MGAQLGMASMLQGAVHGIDKGMQRRDIQQERDYTQLQRQREGVQWDQGQQDRAHSLERQGVMEGRDDEAYKLAKFDDERRRAVADSLREWMTTGDTEKVVETANKFAPGGNTYAIRKNKDGTLTATITDKDGNSTEKVVSEDDIGTFMHTLTTIDPGKALQEQITLKRSAKAQAADNAFNMRKLEREYELKTQLERTKAGLEDGGDSGTKLSKGKTPEYVKFFDSKAGKTYGTLSNGGWTFDSTRKQRMYGTHPELAGATFLAGMGQIDEATAWTTSSQLMSKFEYEAEQQAEIEKDKGQISDKQVETRIADIIDMKVSEEINRLAPKPGQGEAQSLERQSGQQGGSGSAQKQAFIERAKKNAIAEKGEFTPEDEQIASAYYDKTVNSGTAQAGSTNKGGLQAAEAPAASAAKTLERKAPAQLPENAKPTERKVTQAEVNKRRSEINPRKDFDKSNQKMRKALTKPAKVDKIREAKAIIEKLNPDYMQQLTPNQRKKADALIESAKKVLKSN
jgi:hypothetical protein